MLKKMENRHSIWIRLFHWINMISITLLIFTGFYIHAPQTWKWAFDNMDNARMLHFAMAYVLTFGLIGRIYYAIVAKDAHNIVFSPVRDTLWMPSLLAYYLFLKDSHPYYGKYNPGQRGMYTAWVFMALVQIITGFILYAPNTFMSWAYGLGGYIVVREIHYIVNWLWVFTIAIHVYLDLAEGLPGLLSMFTGKIPVGFHGEHGETHVVDDGGKSVGA